MPGSQHCEFTWLRLFVTVCLHIMSVSLRSVLATLTEGPGEPIAHYFEFAFESLSALISFSFCMDSTYTLNLNPTPLRRNPISCSKTMRLESWKALNPKPSKPPKAKAFLSFWG